MTFTPWGRALCLLLLGLSGCGIFDTRDPVPPTATESCPFQDAIRPAITLRNMEQAFSCGILGTDNYQRTLSERFDFNAAVIEDATVREFFDEWEAASDPRQEAVSAYTEQMSAASALTATFAVEAFDEDELPYEDGFRFYATPYSLVFTSGGDTTARFGGKADIYVREAASRFEIYKWDDSEGSYGYPTLGRFWYEGTSAGEVGK